MRCIITETNTVPKKKKMLCKGASRFGLHFMLKRSNTLPLFSTRIPIELLSSLLAAGGMAFAGYALLIRGKACLYIGTLNAFTAQKRKRKLSFISSVWLWKILLSLTRTQYKTDVKTAFLLVKLGLHFHNYGNA